MNIVIGVVSLLLAGMVYPFLTYDETLASVLFCSGIAFIIFAVLHYVVSKQENKLALQGAVFDELSIAPEMRVPASLTIALQDIVFPAFSNEADAQRYTRLRKHRPTTLIAVCAHVVFANIQLMQHHIDVQNWLDQYLRADKSTSFLLHRYWVWLYFYLRGSKRLWHHVAEKFALRLLVNAIHKANKSFTQAAVSIK